MTISTRAELKTAVTTYIVRTDLTAEYDDWILGGENLLNRRLRLLQQETSTAVSVTLTSGNQTASLPTLFLELIKLRYSDIDMVIEQKPLAVVRDGFSSSSGRPQFVAVSADFVFERPSDATYTLKSTYFKKWALGSSSGDTNWLLTNFPYAYLYATLAIAARRRRDLKDPASHWEGRLAQEIAELNMMDARARRGGSLTIDSSMPGTGGSGRYNINAG